MNTRCTYSLTPFGDSRFQRSNGAAAGTYSRLVYSRLPSTRLWLQISGSSVSCAMCFVELDVLLVLDLGARPRPQRLRAIDGLLLLAARRQSDRERDVVGVLANQRLQALGPKELVGVGLELQLHRRAALGPFHGLDAVFAAPVGNPRHALARGSVCAAAPHRDFVGHDERRIEPDAELTDQLRVLALIAGQPLEELARAGARDRAQVLDDLLAAHADAVVRDAEQAPLRIHGDANAELGVGDMSSGRARLSKRSLSLASEAFEISSRRKISRSLYSECTMRCSSCLTSA